MLGCGATLAGLRDVTVLHVTDGAPRDGADAVRHGFANPADYAAARRREAESALLLVGVPARRLANLGIADQEVSRHLAGVTEALAPRLCGADIVLTHAFEGGHSDHDAVAYAVQAALRSCGPTACPTVIEMPFYHGDATGWVRQRFLPHPEAGPEDVRNLDDGARSLKAAMIAAHASQADTLRSFEASEERFRRAPAYDFLQRPHDGPLLYERHGWNLTWPDWCARVKAADAALDRGAA